ncbi:MAG: hypothetical protein WC622_11115 [Pedobacter sp.]|jgi:hypothetical protein|uniref:hypothetical protein n=1 Tax=Pedobacter sp. TaxID=1411316 RepID=UPI00356AD5CC
MKKSNQLATLVMIMFITVFGLSCKKIESADNPLEDAKAWYLETTANTKTNLKSNFGKVKIIRNTVEWDKAKIFKMEDDSDLVGVPITVSLNSDLNANGAYILLISKSNEGYKSIVAYNPKKGYFDNTLTNLEMQNFYTNASKKRPIMPALSASKGNQNNKLMYSQPETPACIDWYWTTSLCDGSGNVIAVVSEIYLYSTCDLGGGGSNTGTTIDQEEVAEEALDTDCSSFTFKKTTIANWQEAGLNKISLRMVWIGGGNGITVRNIEVNHVVFGLPTYYTNANGTTSTLSSGEAANIAAEAAEYARNMTYTEFRDTPVYPPDVTIKSYYTQKVNEYMLLFKGTAGTNGSGSSSIIFNNEERSHYTDPTDC